MYSNELEDFDYTQLPYLTFGELEGEDDTERLSESIIITNSIMKLVRRNYNYILSPKGAGKSAIFNAFKNRIFPKEILHYDDLNIMTIGDSFVYENDYLNPKRFKHNLENKNYSFAWGLYIISKLIGNINDNYKDFEGYDSFIAKIKQFESFKEYFDLYNIFDHLEKVNLRLDFVVNGQQLRLTPKIHSKKERRTLNLNELLVLINEFYKTNKIRTIILIDRLDNFVGQEAYLTQKKYIEGLVGAIEEIRRSDTIQPILFLRTDLYHSLKIRFEYDKAKSRTLHLVWTHTEILRFLAFRFISNSYILDNYLQAFQDYVSASFKKKQNIFTNTLKKIGLIKSQRDRINLERNASHKNYEKFLKIFFPDMVLHLNKNGEEVEMEFTKWIYTHFIDNNGYINPRSLIYYFNLLLSNQYDAYMQNQEIQDSEYYGKHNGDDNLHLNVFVPEVMLKTYKEIQNEELIGIMSLLSTKQQRDVFLKINSISFRTGEFRYGDVNYKKYDMDKEEYNQLIKYLDIIGFCKIEDNQFYSVPILYQRQIDLEYAKHSIRS